MDFVYGKISQKVEKNQYFPGETETTSTELSNNKILVDVKNPLPESTILDQGKILSINSAGNPEWKSSEIGRSVWGGITGDINDQLDLKEKLVWEPGPGEDSVQTLGTGASAIGDKSVAEGLNTVANSNYSHAEGYASKTVIDLDDTEGQGQASHAEGTGTTAKGTSSHAEGGGTLAIGRDSHAEGNSTTTGGNASHAEGNWTITNNLAEHAEGTFNKSNMASSTFGDAGNTIHSVGIGSAGELEDNRKNALEIMQNGDAYLYGVGDYDGTNVDEAETLQSVLTNSLPTPEADGVALVGVDGEWKQQEGYGYKIAGPTDYVSQNVGGGTISLVRVGDVPDQIPDDLSFEMSAITNGQEESGILDNEYWYTPIDGLYIMSLTAAFIYIVTEANLEFDGVVFSKPGVYFSDYQGNTRIYITRFKLVNSDMEAITWDGNYGSIVPFDETYIPDSVKLPVSEEDGNALISVNGEWKKQNGYGYAIARQKAHDQRMDYAIVSQESVYKVCEIEDIEIPDNLEVNDWVTVFYHSLSDFSDIPDGQMGYIKYNDNGILCIDDTIFIITNQNGADYDYYGWNLHFDSPGVYFSLFFEDGQYSTISGWVYGFSFEKHESGEEYYMPDPIVTWDGKTEIVTTIDEKFIPNIFVKKEDLHIDEVIDSSSTHESIPTSLAVKNYVETNGLPAPESDGVALIGVNGEWVQQDGYGYTVEREFFDEEGDGSIILVKVGEVSDIPSNLECTMEITKVQNGSITYRTGSSNILQLAPSLYVTSTELPVMICTQDNTILPDPAGGESLVIEKAGIYFSRVYLVLHSPEEGYMFNSSFSFVGDDKVYTWDGQLTYAVTIDPKFIPSDSAKQNISDSTLETLNKTVPGAINETRSIALGVNQAVSFENYSTMITSLNAAAKDVHRLGQNIYILTVEVPDLWVSSVEDTSVPYTYTTDAAFTSALNTDGYVQIGYYKVSALETQKVILTDYSTTAQMNAAISQAIGGAINASY